VGSKVQILPDPPVIGGVAQLGERVLCKHEVIGSIPFTSTSFHDELGMIPVFRNQSSLFMSEKLF
jgi:hypothetical protein